MAVGANGLDETKCIKEHTDLVKVLAGKYASNGFSEEDLQQEGLIGLLVAIRKWDPSRGASLRTYATPWIIDHIQRAIGRDSDSRKVTQPPVDVSLDSQNEDGASLHDTLQGPSATPEELYSEAEEKRGLANAISSLSVQEQEVLGLRLRDLSQEEVAIATERSRQRCQEIEARAVATLTKRMAS